jgi:hypothetical protein
VVLALLVISSGLLNDLSYPLHPLHSLRVRHPLLLFLASDVSAVLLKHGWRIVRECKHNTLDRLDNHPWDNAR